MQCFCQWFLIVWVCLFFFCWSGVAIDKQDNGFAFVGFLVHLAILFALWGAGAFSHLW